MARTAEKTPLIGKRLFVKTHSRKYDAAMRFTFFIGVCYLLFVLIGTVWSAFSDSLLRDYFYEMTVRSISQKTADPIAVVLIKTVFPLLVSLLLCCVFANSAVGTPFLIAMLVFYGFRCGAIGAAVALCYHWSGFAAHCITRVPSAALEAFAVVLAVSQGIRTSVSIAGVVTRGKSRNLNEVLHRFYHSIAVSAAASVTAGLAEGILLRIFGGIFV